MNPLGEFLKKWWLPVAGFLLASAPPAFLLYFRNILTPYIEQLTPEVQLNTVVLLLWLVFLLVAFIVTQHPWLKWDEPTGTWVSRITALRYCAKCKATKIVTPLKNEVTGWRCMHCQHFFHDPAREHIESPKKKATKSERV